MRFRLTKAERSWVFYDIGNSAFILLISTLLPIYFHGLAAGSGVKDADSVAYWGYAVSVSTLLVALIGPVLGALSDRSGRKKWMFASSILLGAICCILLGIARQWMLFLVLFVAAKISCAISLIFYDSMLTDITDKQRMDSVSAQGYAWGYIGSCIPFLFCLILVLGGDSFGLSMTTAMTLAFTITALWWIAASVPLIRTYRQKHSVAAVSHAVKSSFWNLWQSLKEIAGTKSILLFLIAFVFYIDGVYTLIDMATVYGSALGLDQTGLLLALLLTQVVAFPSTILIGRLSRKIASRILISICICAYFLIVVFAMFLQTQLHFWILAFAVGLFQGGIQSLSRSHFAKLIPPEKSGEYFGLMDICGKGASFMGTTTISLVSQFTGSMQLGVGAIAIFFLIGLVLFLLSVRKSGLEAK